MDDEVREASRQGRCVLMYRRTKRKTMCRQKISCCGSVLLIVVFLLALTAALVIGMLHLTTEELLQIRNQTGMAQALSAAEAGLHDAIAEIRQDSSWRSGFLHKPFFEDSYTVSVTGSLPLLTIDSTGMTAGGYQARLRAEVQVGLNPPYAASIESFRINP